MPHVPLFLFGKAVQFGISLSFVPLVSVNGTGMTSACRSLEFLDAAFHRPIGTTAPAIHLQRSRNAAITFDNYAHFVFYLYSYAECVLLVARFCLLSATVQYARGDMSDRDFKTHRIEPVNVRRRLDLGRWTLPVTYLARCHPCLFP